MLRIIIGIILFLVGFASFLAAESSATGGTVWTGGMLVGGILVISGIARVARQQ